MPILLFKLRGVPEDEAGEIRALLEAEGIEFYETPEGRWGVSMPAIWLRDESGHERAKRLIETYQHERVARARREYAEKRARGEIETVLDGIRERPLRVILAVAAILFILYFVTRPFMGF